MFNRVWTLMIGVGVATLLLLHGCGKRQDHPALREGLRSLDAGRAAQSIRLFQEAVRDNVSREDNALAYNGMGIAYARIQQKDHAVRAFENAARMDPRLMEPVYNLGVVHFEKGKEADAVICFEKAALINARETRSLEFLAFIYQKRRQWEDARRVLTEARSRAPGSARVMTSLALLELRTNNVTSAVALLQQVLEHDAQYPPALFNLAVVNQHRLNKPAQARTHFEDYLSVVSEGPQADNARQALKALPESPPAPTPMTSAGPEPQALSERKPEPPSVVKVKPAPLPVAPPSPAELIANAKKLERAGRHGAAVNNYLRAAREAERTGNGKVKDQALRDAAELCADDAQANYEMGRYYFDHKQNDPAMGYLKKAVSQKTNWFDAHLALATAALEAGEFDTARVSVKQADRSRPDQPEALWGLARLCDRHVSLQDLAAQFYAQFEKKYPADPRVAAARERVKTLRGDRPHQPDNASGSAEGMNPHATSGWWNLFSK